MDWVRFWALDPGAPQATALASDRPRGGRPVSQSVVARIEIGLADRIAPWVLERVAKALGARMTVRLDWNGEALDRLLDAGHATLVERVANLFRSAGWEVAAEVTFWVRGERGSVDLLAWHEASGVAIVVEVKSVVPDVQATLMSFDRKGRLGREIAVGRGWKPTSVGRLLVIGESRTSRRRVAAFSTIFEAEVPDRFVVVRRYLAAPDPAKPLRGLLFLPGSRQATTRHRQPGVRRAA